MEEPAALRPLLEAADAIRRLEEYGSTDDLAGAILTVADAVERSLRIRLHNDPAAPDQHRLSALAHDALPFDEVVKSLRTRDLISLDAAGTVHEARAAARRAETGATRPSDGRIVRAAVDRLRADLRAGAAPPAPAAAAGEAEMDVSEMDGPTASDASDASDPSVSEPDGRVGGGRWIRWVAAAFAAAMVLGAVWVGVRGQSAEFDDALMAFRSGRLDSAAVGFERVLEDRPEHVTTMLYLARSQRRLGRMAEAADVLRRAVEVDREDADVRRELGHLFRDLDRPSAAVAQYERALEYDPDSPRNWAALIAALRKLEDPRAEQLLRDAPADIQAALSGA